MFFQKHCHFGSRLDDGILPLFSRTYKIEQNLIQNVLSPYSHRQY